VSGRFTRDSRKISLGFAAPQSWIRMVIDFFRRFELVTRSTG
jgi:hypothetical protein